MSINKPTTGRNIWIFWELKTGPEPAWTLVRAMIYAILEAGIKLEVTPTGLFSVAT
jgi:hypothetical protein